MRFWIRKSKQLDGLGVGGQAMKKERQIYIYIHTYTNMHTMNFMCSLLHYCTILWASLVAEMVKNLPAVWETQVQSLGWEDMLYSTILGPLLLFSHRLRLPWWLTQ